MIRLIWSTGFLILLALSTNQMFGQCNNCNAQWPAGTLSTTSPTLSTVSTCMRGGEYAVFNVTAGETYTWTTCGGGSWDTQLTLYAGGAPGCQGASLAYNDDIAGCGLLSTITWTATFTGTVNVLLSRWNCLSHNVCMEMQWACVSCSTAPVTGCSGNFYDSGGPGGNYSNNEFTITTLCPDIAGECINAFFNSFDVENNFDFLTVYDGNSMAAPVIGQYTGNALAGLTVQATNASGCLTFLFESDASITRPGWNASISCAECGTPPPAVVQDCIGGTTVCSDATFSGNSAGSGAVTDLNSSNQGCLAGGENQTSWYLFSPATDGNVGFTLSPNFGVDYDFAVWGPFPPGSTSADVCPPPSPPIRCSFASGFSTWNATGSYNTGIGHSAYSAPQFGSPFVTYTEGAGGNGWVSGITVSAGQVYVLVIDNWSSNSTPFNLNWNLQNGASLDCAPLPVELLELTGAREGDHNVLRWKTASETNADYFEIQRSDNGVDYRPISTVNAAGFSSNTQSYVYRDEFPESRSFYYRLKQVDFDGAFEYLGPVFINNQAKLPQFGKPYPNPTENGVAQIDVNFPYATQLTSTVLDALGRPMTQNNHSIARGAQPIRLDLSALAPGIYYVRFSDDSGIVHVAHIIR